MDLNVLDNAAPQRRLPPWLKRPMPQGIPFSETTAVLGSSGVATVCREARCPNLTECWSRKTATFMILGDKCTRRCHYCNVLTARPDPPSPTEPARLADAAAKLGLRHVVITAVARDDIEDEGANHFAECVRAVHRRLPDATVEVLPADFHARPECVRTVVDAGPDIYNHNLETVERMTPVVRPQGRYGRSLRHLELIKESAPDMLTKSGLMVGLGETGQELETAMGDLRSVGCDILTVGQYLQPSRSHAPVEQFYRPEEFEEITRVGESLGFLGVSAGPFVRSSYNADLVFEKVRSRKQEDQDSSNSAADSNSRV